MIFIFFTGLGPGGLRKAFDFDLDFVCVPGSSHGGIALARGDSVLYSDVAYDQQDTVSLLGGSGGEINYFKINCGSDLSTDEGCNGNWLIRKKNKKNFGQTTITVPYGIITTTNQAYIRRINCVLTAFY